MMIWKVELKSVGINTIELPIDATYLKTDFQEGVLFIWYSFSKPLDTKSVEIEVVPTGVEFDSARKRYLGTAVSDDLVWHLYQVI